MKGVLFLFVFAMDSATFSPLPRHVGLLEMLLFACRLVATPDRHFLYAIGSSWVEVVAINLHRISFISIAFGA